MTRKPDKKRLTFEFAEEKVPLRAWSDEDGAPGYTAIERDVCVLLNEIAEVRFAMADQERQGTVRMQRVLLGIIEVLDGFERVFVSVHEKQDQVTPQMKKWLMNFRTLYRLLRNVLAEAGVTPVENLDQGFDPFWHKVAGVDVDLTRPEGTIVQEVLRGYVWQNRVLRKAEVIVVRHSPLEELPEDQEEGAPGLATDSGAEECAEGDAATGGVPSSQQE